MSLRELTDVLTALLFYYFLLSWLVALADMAALKAKISLYRAGEEKPIERYKTRSQSRKRINYFRRPKKILSSFLGSTSKLKSSAWGHLTWNFTAWQKSMAKRRITPYQHSSNPRVNCRFQAGGGVRERLGWQWQWCRYWVRRTGYWWANDDKQGQEDKSRSGQGLMLRRVQNGKPGHTNLLIKALWLIWNCCHLQTNKQVQLDIYTSDTGYMYMDLSFLVYFL